MTSVKTGVAGGIQVSLLVLGLMVPNARPAQAQPPGIPVRITNPTIPVSPPPRQGFNVSCFTGNVDPVYGQASCTLLTIPKGRQIVIETISCQASLAAGQGPGDVQLIVPNTPFTPGSSDHVSHTLAMSKQAGDASGEIRRVTTPLRAYGSADKGAVGVGVSFRALPGPQIQGMSCTLSGYLVGQ